MGSHVSRLPCCDATAISPRHPGDKPIATWSVHVDSSARGVSYFLLDMSEADNSFFLTYYTFVQSCGPSHFLSGHPISVPHHSLKPPTSASFNPTTHPPDHAEAYSTFSRFAATQVTLKDRMLA